MADTHIKFRQGGALTGDSGERGTDLAEDGGVQSIKPTFDSERAHEAVFQRPTENLRRRSEVLRGESEGLKYLHDQARWLISAGAADGVGAGEPWPNISAWAKDGVGAGQGKFTVVEDLVLQPINTPATDKLELVTWNVTDDTPSSGSILAQPVSRRGYSGANLLRVIWAQASAAELATAVEPGKCDIEISGDPDHIFTITILNNDTTTLQDLSNAFTAVIGALLIAGIQFGVTGTMTTKVEYADLATPGTDYQLKGTFDRELHYIPAALFTAFFGGGGYLEDGDTLSVSFPYLIAEDPLSTVDGRRQAISANSNTEIAGAQLFNTSVNPELIPLSIPLCKRIGDDLFWIDGTFVGGAQSTFPIYFGEHGYSIDRVSGAGGELSTVLISSDWFDSLTPTWAGMPTPTIRAAINGIVADLASGTANQGSGYIGKSPYPWPGGTGYRENAVWYPVADDVEDWLNALLLSSNLSPHLAGNELITGSRTYSYWNEITGQIMSPDPWDDSVVKDNEYILEHPEQIHWDGSPTALSTRKIWHFEDVGSDHYYRNGVIEGLHVDGNITTPGNTVINTIRIHSGAAYVGGRVVVLPSDLVISGLWEGSLGLGGLTEETKNMLNNLGSDSNCMWLYVWLRSDGKVWVESWGPDLNESPGGLDTWKQGSCYYRPRPESGLPHTAEGFTDTDYTLIDVCWLVQGNAGAGDADTVIRIAGAAPVGGSYRHFERAKYYNEGFLNEVVHYFVHQDNSFATDNMTTMNRINLGSSMANRTPGVPVVAHRARINATAQITVSEDPGRIRIGRLDDTPGSWNAKKPYLYIPQQAMLPYGSHFETACLEFFSPGISAAQVGGSFISYHNECVDVMPERFKIGTGLNGRSEIPISKLKWSQDKYLDLGSSPGTPPDFLLWIQNLGFYWDRQNGPNVTDHPYLPTP